MRKILSVALVFLAASIASALAQTYPSRPITMMVPFPPGGLTDVVGRLVAEGMRTALGQTIIIENVGGATGSIGTGRVARAAPDGYTITVGIWNTHVANGIAEVDSLYPAQPRGSAHTEVQCQASMRRGPPRAVESNPSTS
jgi:tripartite-type tricarboxylate transporter receptor subunit TctC